MIAALLLTLADVPELVIAADYGHTARNGLARLRDLPIDTPGLPKAEPFAARRPRQATVSGR